MTYQCAIFDLDGVLVDTAKYHYLAWKELADELGFTFTQEQNERLKGVSRMASLEILLEVGGMQNRFTLREKERYAIQKNTRYVEYVSKMDESEILEGALDALKTLRRLGVKIALGSASKNSPLILKNVGIANYFDVVIDGNSVSKAKPDPEVFTLGADKLGLPYRTCVVFEDARAGLQAAKKAGMLAIGIGVPENLPEADAVFPNLKMFDIAHYFGA